MPTFRLIFNSSCFMSHSLSFLPLREQKLIARKAVKVGEKSVEESMLGL